jgi:DNA-binding XRE family transcriptional regulator
MEQVLEVPLSPCGSFGALVRECRHQAFLSQEQLAERAELSERTVRNLEAERVRSPRPDTVRLLADALELSGPERAGWFAAARRLDHRLTVPAAGGPVPPPGSIPARRPADAPGRGTGNQRWRRRCPGAGSGTGIAGPGRREAGPGGAVANESGPAGPVVVARAGEPGLEALGGGLSSADRRELAELRQENRRLREDLQILKRAAAIFAGKRDDHALRVRSFFRFPSLMAGGFHHHRLTAPGEIGHLRRCLLTLWARVTIHSAGSTH